MKTDRRHELQTNVLADWIGKHLQQLEGHSKTILAVILLVIAAAIGGTFLVQQQSARDQVAWNQFFEAYGDQDPQALEAVAMAHPGMTAGIWAQLAEADLKLSEGIGDLYTNRTNAKENLAEAERSYLAVDGAATEDLLRERAWFGLGQVYESQAELEKARQYYDRLASHSPMSALGKEAKRRSDALRSPETEKWYNWFANQTPRPAPPPGMEGEFGLPGVSSDLDQLSDRPDLSFPQPAAPRPVETPPAAESPEPGPELNSPASEPAAKPTEGNEPAADSVPPQDETPAAEKPAAESAPDATTPESKDAPAEGSSTPGDPAPE